MVLSSSLTVCDIFKTLLNYFGYSLIFNSTPNNRQMSIQLFAFIWSKSPWLSFGHLFWFHFALRRTVLHVLVYGICLGLSMEYSVTCHPLYRKWKQASVQHLYPSSSSSDFQPLSHCTNQCISLFCIKINCIRKHCTYKNVIIRLNLMEYIQFRNIQVP